jgi:flavin-binding protein dodecin
VGYIDEGVVKVIEVIGVSETSWEDAVAQAVAKSAESLTGITGVEVVSFTARVNDAEVTTYNATCKIAFVVK